MADITPKMVKELRDKTGAGMGDCKKALVESEGDMQEAIEILRKKGAASAAKRADRSAKEGLIVALTNDDGSKAAITEVNCETDFVAKNEEFVDYANKVAEAVLNSDAANYDDLMKVTIGSDTLQGIHNEILAKFSENIGIRRFERLQSEGFISAYIHAGSKLAVLVEVSESNLSDSSRALVRDIAMQVAAMSPMFISRDDVSRELVDKELEIYRQQAVDSGKKEDIADKIAQGRLNKYFQEQCLLEQAFVKDSNMIIKDVLKQISEETGKEVKVLSFKRFFLGEEA